MPDCCVCRTAVLETVSLPPTLRSSEMPLPANPSMLVFSITTETPAAWPSTILIPCRPSLTPLMSSQLSRTVLYGSSFAMLITMPLLPLVASIEP